LKTSTSSLSFRCPFGSPSFALISVLALVSLAALTATAFLASARLERTATRPLGEKVRLEMALNIGFNCAKEIINSSVGSSYDTVATYWRTDPADDVGYLLSGYPRNLANATPTPQMYWFAAFSTANMTELATNAPPTAVMTNRVTVDNQSMFSNKISEFMLGLTNFGANGSTNIELIGHTTNSPRLSPPVGWMTIKQPVRTTPGKTNTVSTPVMRIAFFTEDLSGLIDAERMCGTTSRDTGTNPTEISMANIGFPTPGGIPFGTATNTRATYLSPFLMVTNGGIATTNLRYFATGLRSWTNAPQRIPRSIAIGIKKTYGGATGSNSNGAKFLIPTDPTASDVAKIAAALTTNLPDFGARGGAMNSTAYVNNIAASIVDYVDADSTPNADTANPPAWRGVENIAWPNEVYTRFNLESRTIKESSYEFKLGVKQYIEVWNLGSKALTVTGANYSISNNLNIPLQCTNWNSNLKSADPATLPASEACTNLPFLLPANSYGVVSAPTRTFTILVPISLVPKTLTPMLTINPSPSSSTNNKYTISYSNKIIDATPGGRWLGSLANMRVGDFHFITTAANFGTTANGSSYNLAGGDPRGGLFIQKPMMDMPYNQTTPGGRNSHMSSSGGARIADPKVNWVDGGHSSVADITTSPTNANVNNSIPQGLQKQGKTNHWAQKINDTGTLTNVMELGNIFDPIQWGDPNNPFHPLDTAAWMVLTNTATAFSGACGRNTLRIGRPEHQRFAFTNLGGSNDLPIPNMGQSAAALLDIFCATNAIDDGGKININTAPAAVLAALAGGITLKADSANTKPGDNTNMVKAFTNGVMQFRQAYPFYSTSQLPFISANYGDKDWTNTWHTSTVFSTNTGCGLQGMELNDQGMEEWFSKIYGLSSVQSRNFRIYVYAQMVTTNKVGQIVPYGRVMRKYYDLYTEQSAEKPNEKYNDAGYSMVPERESEY